VSRVQRVSTQLKLLLPARLVSRELILVTWRLSAWTVLQVSTQAMMKQYPVPLVLLVSSLRRPRRPFAPTAPRASTQAMAPLHAQTAEEVTILQLALLHV